MVSRLAGSGAAVMPFYLLCDVSRAMTGNIAALSDGVARLQQAITSEPLVDDIAQFCIVSFSDSAKVLFPLEHLSGSPMPQFAIEGGTCYGAAFQMLAEVIGRDAKRLRGDGYRLHRPCAFFLVGSAPQDDDWHQTFLSSLSYDPGTGMGMKMFPIFTPYGFWGAPESALSALAYPPITGQWYHAKNTSLEDALDGILRQIIHAAVQSRFGGAMDPVPPEPRWPLDSVEVIGRGQLGSLDVVGKGAFSTVYRVSQFVRADEVVPLAYKEFTGNQADQGRAAARTIAFRAGLPRVDRDELDARATWPRALVADESGEISGLLMPLLPPQFFFQGPDNHAHELLRPRDFAWLGASKEQRKAAEVDLPEIDHGERLYLLAELARTVALLHRHSWVFGDISFNNIVFAFSPARTMLLDCGEAAALDDLERRQPHTPNWLPPEHRTPSLPLQDTASDCYKLGLAIVRCMTPGPGFSTTRDSGRLAGVLDAEGIRLVTCALSADPGQRPSAEQLYAYLAKQAAYFRLSARSRRLPEESKSHSTVTEVTVTHTESGESPDVQIVLGHVFISYAREDASRVDELESALTSAGVPVWRDTSDLWPGQDWESAIRLAIQEGTLAFLACFSQAGLARKSRYQNVELTLAIDQLRRRLPGDTWFIPVRFDDCSIPPIDIGGGRNLMSFQRADLFGTGSEAEMHKLIIAVKNILNT